VRVLVVYGSSRGGTAGLAHMVAEAFVARGILADIGDATDIDAIEDYDAVVLGGALYHGRWHKDASWFVERNLAALRARSVWFFSSGPLDDSARSGSLAPVTQVQELARRADIRGHMTFGGILEERSSGFLSSLLAWGKPGDFRDRQHVEEWVERIIARLDTPGRTATLFDDSVATPERGANLVARLLTEPDEVADDDLGLDVFVES
jgi:menaquinone-dependent protoporphyrinogen oxidase